MKPVSRSCSMPARFCSDDGWQWTRTTLSGSSNRRLKLSQLSSRESFGRRANRRSGSRTRARWFMKPRGKPASILRQRKIIRAEKPGSGREDFFSPSTLHAPAQSHSAGPKSRPDIQLIRWRQDSNLHTFAYEASALSHLSYATMKVRLAPELAVALGVEPRLS